METKDNKTIKILWAICLIPLFAGIIMISCSTSKIDYSTDEYWVAKDYHHVYEKYSGEIVDYISKNETCSIKGDTITVTTKNKTLYGWGVGITALFGMFTVGMIWGCIETSDWWYNFRDKFR